MLYLNNPVPQPFCNQINKQQSYVHLRTAVHMLREQETDRKSLVSCLRVSHSFIIFYFLHVYLFDLQSSFVVRLAIRNILWDRSIAFEHTPSIVVPLVVHISANGKGSYQYTNKKD